MEKRKKMILSGVGVAAVGLALILGNGLLSLTAFAGAQTSQEMMRALEVSDTISDGLADRLDGDAGVTMNYAQGGEPVLAPSGTSTLTTTDDASSVIGQPGEGDLSEEAAKEAAADALVQKYALNAATLDRFTMSARFIIADPTQPVWAVVFDPANPNDFAAIGSYMVKLDPKTGEVLSTMSAADGVG